MPDKAGRAAQPGCIGEQRERGNIATLGKKRGDTFEVADPRRVAGALVAKMRGEQSMAEWLYTGKAFQRLTLLLLMALFVVGILGGHVMEPRMKELQEKMKKLKENPKRSEREMQELQKEQMELMKEANPMGGCLPMLLQMPIFWSFFIFLTICVVLFIPVLLKKRKVPSASS